MPHRRVPNGSPEEITGRNFRQRYDAIEQQRTRLLERMHAMNESARRHPSYKKAQTLLNATFRKTKLAQRVAVLQAAEWLVDLIERLTLLA